LWADDLRQDRGRWHIARRCDPCAEMTRQRLQKGRIGHEPKLGEHVIEALAGRGCRSSGAIETSGIEEIRLDQSSTERLGEILVLLRRPKPHRL
jgi:phosphohistidine phosphatase SixA